jgi:hypothetical protein
MERRAPMAIYRLLKFFAFDPEEITCMTAAYEDALRLLQLANRQDPITELVAKKIIEVTQAGDSLRKAGRSRSKGGGDFGRRFLSPDS